MSAPTKFEQLEEYADSTLYLTKVEMLEFCLTIITDPENMLYDDKGAEYMNKTFYEPSWFVEEFFKRQAWDMPATISWLTDCLKYAADHGREFDT